jgi:hypothetical protein
MCCCSKRIIKWVSLVILFIVLILSIALIIYTGVEYNSDNQNWQYMSFTGMNGALQLAAIAFMIVVAVVGILGFFLENTLILIIFAILAFLAFIFLTGIAILDLIVDSNIRSDQRNNIGCNTNYTPLLNSYKIVDTYMQNVDTAFCSTSCPCNIYNPFAFTAYPNTYATWVSNTNGVNNFTSCSAPLQNNVYTNSLSQYQSKTGDNSNRTFSTSNFANYWGSVETRFNCSGFCNTTYLNNQGQSITIAKYLFSDINRGPPNTIGCYAPLFAWFANFLEAYGIIALIIALLMLILIILVCFWCCCPKPEVEIPSHHVEMAVDLFRS